jgi:valyl-tRNA synthetase
VLVTGYDILFFWVVRMMMLGLYAMADREQPQPFYTIALHGMVRDKFGKKMSKSRGNGVDPIAWMDAYGSDAVRFTFARGANPGADVPIGEEMVQGARSFCTKLWNATRFALINGATVEGGLPETLIDADAWIISRLNSVIAEVDSLYERFEFAKIADLLYHFAWDEICDWYLELAKVTLADPAAAPTTKRVLGEVLDSLLRLLHPMIPFITEALWIELTGGESLVVASWPVAQPDRLAPAVEAAVADVQNVITEVRRFRSDQGLRPGQRVPAEITGASEFGERAVRALLRLTEPDAGFTPSASLTTASGVGIDIDLSGTIDIAAERARLSKDRAVAVKEQSQAQAKLGNEAFVAKAPEAVVTGIRTRLATAEAEIARIDAALAALDALAALPSPQ